MSAYSREDLDRAEREGAQHGETVATMKGLAKSLDHLRDQVRALQCLECTRRIESNASHVRALWTVLSILTVALLMLAIQGCAGGPDIAPSAATTPTATPTITTGDGALIEQRLTQLTQSIQETTSTITHNNALDAERRKLEESRDRKDERREASNGLLIAGIILFAFLIKAPVAAYWRGIIMIVSISLIGGAFLMPYLWPF